MSVTKLCYKCKVTKPESDFYKDHYGKYGLSSKCKVCSANTFKEYYEKNRISHLAYCKEHVTCKDCFETYARGSKYAHDNTQKHKDLSEELKNSVSLEGLLNVNKSPVIRG